MKQAEAYKMDTDYLTGDETGDDEPFYVELDQGSLNGAELDNHYCVKGNASAFVYFACTYKFNAVVLAEDMNQIALKMAKKMKESNLSVAYSCDDFMYLARFSNQIEARNHKTNLYFPMPKNDSC